jgi:hypothetical protein
MILTMPYNHWAVAMFRRFAGSIAEHGVIAAAKGAALFQQRKKKDAVRGGSDSI